MVTTWSHGASGFNCQLRKRFTSLLYSGGSDGEVDIGLPDTLYVSCSCLSDGEVDIGLPDTLYVSCSCLCGGEVDIGLPDTLYVSCSCGSGGEVDIGLFMRVWR